MFGIDKKLERLRSEIYCVMMGMHDRIKVLEKASSRGQLIGARIQDRMEQIKMSRAELCKKIASDQSFINKIINGKNASLKTYEKIAEALNISVDELIYGTKQIIRKVDFDV